MLSEPAAEGDVKLLSELVERMKREGDVLERARAKLKQMETNYRQLIEVDIPTACDNSGIMGIQLPSGEKLEIKDNIRASIPKAKQEEAFSWLRENGYGDLIKNVVSVSFGMGEDDLAEQAAKTLASMDTLPEQKKAVHASTLKAWVKERTLECDEIPDELFGVYRGQRAVLK